MAKIYFHIISDRKSEALRNFLKISKFVFAAEKNLDNFGFRLISTRNSFVITSGISESRVVLEDLDLSQDSNTEKSLLKIFNFCERLKYFHTFLSLTRKTSIKN